MSSLFTPPTSRSGGSRAWIGGEPETTRRLRVFALPFAGGNAASFGEWSPKLPGRIAFSPVHLPGRERRIMEPAIDDAATLISQLVPAITPWLDRPYALFGHSMGAMLAYELAVALGERGLRGPELLIVSGHGAPNLPRRFPVISHLADREFLAAVMELGGLPSALLEEPELLALVLPSLRADFRLCETYEWHARPPLACPILAIGGRSDPIAGLPELRSWQAMTSEPLACEMFDGNHFFIHHAMPAVVALIARAIAERLRDSSSARGPTASELRIS
ncbi:Linear gramicidin dehydrogenase lgrE [Bradyrhizobium sp. ORS 375]|uniref:thioesterase II family protein n=1 Tax=Bradyrhizobium sp. (strain ORS 375) TaxID=566679 RepID=UPI00024096BC|nr:alpha/beta fold hydrolase [Bradyrhizobium sp. ORS 375]CCD97018.1 Linear gramicidin dehydrogenase lgrE [Bradyrhizobium sp. ORS 375]